MLSIKLNIDKEINKLLENDEYLWLKFLLLLVKKIYNTHFSDKINAIKVSKSDIKNDKEEIIWIAVDEVALTFNDAILHYLDTEN